MLIIELLFFLWKLILSIVCLNILMLDKMTKELFICIKL